MSRIRVVKRDVLEELHDAMTCKRPGTANSDINVFALPIEITYGLAYRVKKEIERLRVEKEKSDG